MLSHFLHLLAASWHLFREALGTTTLGFIAPLIVSVGSIVITLYWVLREHGKEAMIKRWREDAWIALRVTAIVTTLVYGPIWFYDGLIKGVYEDHMGLVQENQKLLHAGSGNPFSIVMNNQYASMLNSFMAFSGLCAGDGQVRDRCDVRITAPAENQKVAQVMNSIARAARCFVEPGDSLRPERENDIPADVVILHMRRGERNEDRVFATMLSNTLNVRLENDIGNQENFRRFVWIQIGTGNVWRKG